MNLKTRWSPRNNPSPDKVAHLQEVLGVEELVAKLLVNRGIETFEQAKLFFRPELSHLHDPFLMKDMDKAVQRIEQALLDGENILVYGDYDVDGTSAVALMSTYLKTRSEQILTYIPDRYEEGYGVSYRGIDFAHDNDFSLIIALDCGIKAIEKVAYAKEKGIDFIICDHHRPGDELPEAFAVLDPKRADCSYPYDELCGCGVGFKLIQALEQKRGNGVETLMPFLDLVATAIGADIVPITGENRVLAFYGLKQINENPRAGIKAIIHQLNKKELTITDVVFIIAPRINAAGRMEHGKNAVDLLSEENFEKALSLAAAIEVFNSDRKDLDQSITQEALLQIKNNKEEKRFTTVVRNENWHKGVIGIVASRLIETYYRPTLVFTKSGEKWAASARSVKGFDVYEALEQCSEFIEQFGGHKYAAGLTLYEKDFLAFKQRFEEVVKDTITPECLLPEISYDAEIRLNEISPKLMRIIKQFAPFGPGNMSPVFKAKGLRDSGYARSVGGDEAHLKLSVYQSIEGKRYTLDAIGFNLGTKLQLVTNQKSFDAIFTLDENEWNGIISLQIKIRDIV